MEDENELTAGSFSYSLIPDPPPILSIIFGNVEVLKIDYTGGVLDIVVPPDVPMTRAARVFLTILKDTHAPWLAEQKK